MSDIVYLVKKCALDAVNAAKPTELVLGRVTREEDTENNIPLEITLEQKAVLQRDFLFDTKNTHSLKKDEILLLLRQSGAQKYLLLDKLEEVEK